MALVRKTEKKKPVYNLNRKMPKKPEEKKEL
jgi:hypothetical protein